MAASENARLMNEKILLDATRKQEKARRAQADEDERLRAEKVSGLADGELEMRDLELDQPIGVDGHIGVWSKWTLFAGRQEPLWTSYTAEPAGSNSFVKASVPTVTVQVIDFSRHYYLGPQGSKRIDGLVNEITRLKEVRSPQVARVYAVQRTKSPKGWDRVVVVVERVADGGRLSTWLPNSGFGEEMAKDYITQLLSGLVDLHRQHVNQKRELTSERERMLTAAEMDIDQIILSPSPNGDMALKLYGTGYARRIIEYHRSNPFLRMQENGYPDSWCVDKDGW